MRPPWSRPAPSMDENSLLLILAPSTSGSNREAESTDATERGGNSSRERTSPIFTSDFPVRCPRKKFPGINDPGRHTLDIATKLLAITLVKLPRIVQYWTAADCTFGLQT